MKVQNANRKIVGAIAYEFFFEASLFDKKCFLFWFVDIAAWGMYFEKGNIEMMCFFFCFRRWFGGKGKKLCVYYFGECKKFIPELSKRDREVQDF